MKISQKSAFTLVELLVVIAIVAIIGGLIWLYFGEKTKLKNERRMSFVEMTPTVTTAPYTASVHKSPRKLVGNLYSVLVITGDTPTIIEAISTHGELCPGQQVALEVISYRATPFEDERPIYWAELVKLPPSLP